MTRLFRRRAVAYLGDVGAAGATEAVRIEGLDMSFKVEKNLSKHPNTLDLEIWNLAPATLARVQQKYVGVLLVAGYEAAPGERGELGQIFKGEVRSVVPRKEGPDLITSFSSGDGEVAFGWARTTQSFAPGAGVLDVVKGLARSAGIGIGNAAKAFAKGNIDNGLEAFADGFTASGKVADELDTVIRSAGFSWSIQDGELQLLKGDTDAVNKGQAVAEVINADTGMVGSPEIGSNSKAAGGHLLRVKCLMRPSLRVGSIVQVESEHLPPGQFRCEKVTHEGNTAGGDWYSTIEGRSV